MQKEFEALDYVKMDERSLTNVIPTSQRIDFPEYLYFEIKPTPKLDKGIVLKPIKDLDRWL